MEDPHKVFIAPIQVRLLLVLVVPPCWTVCCQCAMLRVPLQHATVAELATSRMAIAHAMSAKFKEFSFPVN